MNPIEGYHDPALEGLVQPTSKSASRHSRRISGQVFDPADLPFAPDVPRGPPISYGRNGSAAGGVPQRSFSQRAKGRPYAREAYEEEGEADEAARAWEAPVEVMEERRAKGPVSVEAKRSRATDTRPARVQDAVGEARPVARPARMPEAPVPVDARAVARATRTAEPSVETKVGATRPPRADPAIEVRKNATRAAPTKSPLDQEITPMTAKVARLLQQEQERPKKRDLQVDTHLNEKQRTRPAPPISAVSPRINQPRRSSAKPSSAVSRPSTTQQPQSAVSRSSASNGRDWAPDRSPLQKLEVTLNDISKEEKRARVQEAEMLLREQKARQAKKDAPTIEDAGLVRSLSNTHRNRLQHSTTIDNRRPDARRLSGEGKRGFEYETVPAEPSPVPFPKEKTRRRNEEPVEQVRKVSRIRDDEPLPDQDRSALRKDTLDRLTGSSPAAAPERTGSRKLQKAAPIEKARAAPVDAPEDLQTITPPPRIRDGETGSPSAFSSPAMSSRLKNGVGKRQSKSSVTFKEPISKRPIDEWKDAKTARLTLADFALDQVETDKNKAWWEESTTQRRRRRSSATNAAKMGDIVDEAKAEFRPRLFLRCGPLVRYLGLKKTDGKEVWRGSIMIVTQDNHSDYSTPPTLRLFSRPQRLLPPPPEQIVEELPAEYVDPIAGLTKISRIGRPLYVRPVDHLVEEKDLSRIENDDGLFEASPSMLDTGGQTTTSMNNRNIDQDGEAVGKYQDVTGARLYADPDRDVTFWRFNIEVELGEAGQHVSYRINRGASSGFWVPARGTSMNIMFHSCNGFSLSVNTDQFSGPDPLWRDVLNVHQTRPFHVMIGGGDQIYNDRCSVETQHFGEWLKIRNPNHKHHAPFTKEMQEELESFYLERYCMWFSQGLFGMANSQIPMVNIWDDHDIIDGFGSYPDHFMKTPVFSGLGNVAFKYYMLFQHQSVPEETAMHEPSWVLGHEPGPYIHQPSRSVFMHLGKQIAFLGVDCRTERMRDEILSIRTFDNLLERCRQEIVEGETKHLLVLLGVPIAYPRLVWLENVLTSRAMDPIKALNRMGIMKTGFLNKFDGGVEILDDLDDHWTASHHKSERNDLITDLQDLAAEKSVRITILGGDVHLAAVGQFRSNPKLKIPKDHDHRYMPNVISSAIVNTPPPDIMADILNKRNKVHTMDKYTEEDMIPMFTHDVDRKKRNNVHLLPRRNWCSIREYLPGSTPPPSPSTPSVVSDEDEVEEAELPQRRFSFSKEPANLIRKLSTRGQGPSAYPEKPGLFRSLSLGSRRGSESTIPSSAPPVRPGVLRRPTNLSEKAVRKGNVPAIDADGNEIDVNDSINLAGGLDVVLNAEVNQHDPAGITVPYRLLVPALWYDGSSDREKLPNTPIDEKGPLLGRMFSRREKKAPVGFGDESSGEEAEPKRKFSLSRKEKKPVEEAGGAEPGYEPKRKFSLFRRRKDELYSDDSFTDEDEVEPQQQPIARSQTTQQPPQRPQAPQQQGVPQRHSSAPAPAPAPRGQGSYDPRRQVQPELHDPLYDVSNRPPTWHASQRVPVAATKPARQMTIGGVGRSTSDSYPIQRPTSETDSESDRSYSSDDDAAAYPRPMVGNTRRLSKQERVLGMSDDTQQPRVLRGNGIIGRPEQAQGYSGIDAWPGDAKPKRGFSFKKARDWLDGRRDREERYE
jgi:hypothetical protein